MVTEQSIREQEDGCSECANALSKIKKEPTINEKRAKSVKKPRPEKRVMNIKKPKTEKRAMGQKKPRSSKRAKDNKKPKQNKRTKNQNTGGIER